MTVQSLARIIRAIRAIPSRHAVSAIVWLAVCALAQPALSQSISSKRTETRQGVVGVQLEKNAEWAAPLCPGGNIHYTVRITNVGDLAGTAEIVDPIPANTTYVPDSTGGGAFYDSGGDRILWEGFLAPGQSQSIGFSVTVDTRFPVAAIFNDATGRVIAGETVAETQVQVETPLECPPLDLDVDKTAHFAQPLQCPGGNVFFEIRITNRTERGTTLDAVLEDPIPAGTTFEGSLTGGAVYEPGADRVTWEGALGPGDTHTVGFSVTVDGTAGPGDTITNVATVTVSDPQVGDSHEEQATETVSCGTPQAPLELEVDKVAHFAEPLRCPGGTVFFQVRFTNRSDRETPLTARLEDPIPDGMTFLGDLSDGATHDPFTDRVTWTGMLGPGDTQTVGFSATVDAPAGPGETFTNTATVTLSDLEGGGSVQEEATATVSCPGDSGGTIPTEIIKLQLKGDPVCPGSRIDYGILLTNPDDERTLDASIEDLIPANTGFIPDSITGGASYDEAERKIVWDGELEPGGSKLVGFGVEIDAGVPDGTVIGNSAEGELRDPETGDTGRAEDETEVTVDCDPDDDPLQIGLDKTSFPDVPLCPGATIDYEIVLTNPQENGRPLTGLIFDLVPLDTSYVAGSLSSNGGLGLHLKRGERIYWFGILGPGESVTLEYTVEVDDNPLPGWPIFNEVFASLADLQGEDSVWDRDIVFDDLDDCDGGGCPLEVTGFAEDSIGNGSQPYPVSNARVWLFDVGDDPLPIGPLSERTRTPLGETRTGDTFETDLRDEEFPFPERADYEFDLSPLAVSRCPPRTVVTSLLWDAEDRFAVAPRNPLDGRYVPAYLARCISDEPDEVMPAGPCFEWRLDGTSYVPWDPVADERAQVRFSYGSSPTNRESTEVIHDPATANPRLSESWDLGAGTPPDFFFQDAAHVHFFSYKAMEYLTGLAGQVREALADLAEAEGTEPEDLPLAPALITPHDRDCPSGCTWSAPQLADDPLEPLPGRLPLTFGGLRDGGAAVNGSALVSFGPELSSSRPAGGPDPETGDTPDNREWHELGHYWMLQLYDGDWPGGYRNHATDCREVPPSLPPVPPRFGDGHHCGYANQSTTDSFIEGSAEATSMLIAEHYDDPRPFLYRLRGNDQNLEVDHRVWGPAVPVQEGGELTGLELLDPRAEDFAVAGLLWDLADAGPSIEPKAPGVASDTLRTEDRSEQPVPELFAHIRNDLPQTLADLFATLSSAFPADGDADGLTDTEEIFVAHGAFGDDERDLRHDPGEIPGETGSADLPVRPVRLAREPLPNGFVDLGFTVDGFPFAPFGFPLELRYELDPPFDHYDYETTVRSRGRLHLHMPPPLYPCRVTITAHGKDDFADRRSEPLVISCAEYWGAVASGASSMGEHTFELEEDVAPDPPPGPWLTSAELPGFEAKVRITPPGSEPIDGAAEPDCIVETLCVSGALAGRPEIFAKVIGPRPNGKLWTQIARFTPSRVEVWLRQIATQTVRYYDLARVSRTSDDVSGLQDREAFDPAGAPSTVPRGVVLPGAAVEPFDPVLDQARLLAQPLEPGEPEPPENLEWLADGALPGFRFKARITAAGGQVIDGRRVERCIPETLCIQGALAGRPEVFAKIIGPRPNGFLWVQAARFTPSRVELWVERTATGTVRYYRLDPVPRGSEDVSGLQDREAFAP